MKSSRKTNVRHGNKLATSLALSLILVFFACEEDPNFDREINASSIDDLIAQIGAFDPPPAANVVELATTEDSTTTASDGSTYNCSAKEYKLNTVFETLTLSAFDDRAATNTASLYPGSIIKLQDFVNRDELNGIGNFERQPIEISSTLGDIRLVDDPSQRGNVDKQIKDMEGLHDDFAANVKFETTESYSMEQSMLEFGINGSYLGNSVKSKFRVESSVEKKNVFIKFLQVYHTVSMANPIRPSDFFGPSVGVQDLENVTGPGNPLGFISEVAYGRVLVGKFTYTGSEIKTAAELEVEVRKGLANIESGVKIENSKKLETSTFEVAILGGSAEEASQVGGAGIEAVQAAYNFIKNGGSDASLGVPIQYKIKYLKDNSTVATGGVAKYEIPDCNFVPTSLIITNVKFTAIPPLNGNGSNWDTNCGIACDNSKHPDPMFQLKPGSQVVFTSSSKTNVKPGKLPINWDMSKQPFEYGVNQKIRIILRDDDDSAIPSNSDYMGEVSFTYNQDGSGNTITKTNKQVTAVITVDLK